MPRIPRNKSTSHFFHVINQGINKMNIFIDSQDKNYYIQKMHEIRITTGVGIVCYCIMSNHFHIIVKVKKIQDLSKFMQMLNTAYSMHFNKKYKRVGYVFKNRFKSQEIFSIKQMYNTIEYIHNNPVKARICNNPWEYPYSSYNTMYNSNCEFKTKISIRLSELLQETSEFDEERIIDIFDSDDCDAFIQTYFRLHGITRDNVRKNKHKIKMLIHVLKDEYSLSFNKIGTFLRLDQKTIKSWYE